MVFHVLLTLECGLVHFSGSVAEQGPPSTEIAKSKPSLTQKYQEVTEGDTPFSEAAQHRASRREDRVFLSGGMWI